MYPGFILEPGLVNPPSIENGLKDSTSNGGRDKHYKRLDPVHAVLETHL